MKKKIRGLIIIGVTALILTISIIFLLLNPKKKEENQNSSDTSIKVLTLKSSDISEINAENEAGGFTLIRKDANSFKLKDRDSLPQNATKISSVITELTSVTAAKSVVKKAEDLSVYGLDKPKAALKILLTSGQEKTILVGNEALSGDVYFKTKDIDEVFTINEYNLSSYKYSRFDFYDISISSDATQENVDYIKLISEGKTVYELSKLPESASSEEKAMYTSTFEMLSPFKTDSNSTNLSTVLQSLPSLSFVGAVSDDMSKANLEKYGLSNPKHTFVYKYSGKEVTLYLGNKDEKGNFYSYIKGRDILYTISEASITFLKFSSTDMVSSLLYLRNIKEVKSITLEGYGQKYTFELENANNEDNEKLIVKYNGKTYDQDSFRTLYQVMIGVTVSGTGKKPSGEPIAKITFNMLDGTTDLLEYFKYDDRNLFFTINKSGSFYVNKTLVEKIFENCKNYIEGKKINI